MPNNKKKKGSAKKVAKPDLSVTAPAMETLNISSPAPGVSIDFGRFDVYAFELGCYHGASEHHVDNANRWHVLKGFNDSRDAAIFDVDRQLGGNVPNRSLHGHLYSATVGKAEEEFWGKPENSQYIDEKMIAMLLAIGTKEIMCQGNFKDARRYHALACQFAGQLEGALLDADRLMKDTYEARTNRGLKMLLAKKIPCACLDEASAAAKSEERTRKCDLCKTQGTQEEIKKCSRCKLSQYCSKECQLRRGRSTRKNARKPLLS